jgi:hypothetical protein
MGGPGSGRKPSGYAHPVEISKVNGVIKKIGASHHTPKALTRAKMHGRSTKNFGLKNAGGVKMSKKGIAYRVAF